MQLSIEHPANPLPSSAFLSFACSSSSTQWLWLVVTFLEGSTTDILLKKIILTIVVAAYWMSWANVHMQQLQLLLLSPFSRFSTHFQEALRCLCFCLQLMSTCIVQLWNLWDRRRLRHHGNTTKGCEGNILIKIWRRMVVAIVWICSSNGSTGRHK